MSKFEIGEEVIITKKYSPPGVGWASEMDGCINTVGVVKQIEDYSGNDTYLVEFSNRLSYYFGEQSLAKAKNSNLKGVWYISRLSGMPVKYIGRGKYLSYFENIDGEIFSNENIEFYIAPSSCNSFDWREPKKPMLID